MFPPKLATGDKTKYTVASKKITDFSEFDNFLKTFWGNGSLQLSLYDVMNIISQEWKKRLLLDIL